MDRHDPPHRVVIVGGGFGGLSAAKALAKQPVEITLIDRNNYHLFQPLLYQVATAGLSPADIASPIRGILRHQKNAKVILADVSGIDTARREVIADGRRIPYDSLIVATGHLTPTIQARNGTYKISQMASRSGVSEDEFKALLDRVRRRDNEVPASIARLAGAARSHGVPMLSHDDTSPAQRQWFRALGCQVSEFPMTVETAQDASDEGDDIVFGAPNVVRGGSHIGWTKAADMVQRGLCSVLASDYYYPAQLLAAFRLVNDRIANFGQAWKLVSEAPARAAGLIDRGSIAEDYRADLILVDAQDPARPRVVGTIVAGKIVHLTEGRRLMASH